MKAVARMIMSRNSRNDADKDDMRHGYGEIENRFRDRRGREHYDNGRYAPRSMDEYYQPRMHHQEDRMIGYGYDTMRDERGVADSKAMDLDQVTAEQWMRSLPKDDGAKGPKWTKEQVRPYMAQVGYTGPEYKFWAVMNALYSDYCKIARKYGHDRPEYYADLAKAWLEDRDANPEKAGLYYRYIVKH